MADIKDELMKQKTLAQLAAEQARQEELRRQNSLYYALEANSALNTTNEEDEDQSQLGAVEDAYVKAFTERKILVHPTLGNCLVFQSKEEASKFFNELAGKGEKFLLTQMDPKKGELVDNHVFSCGTGKLYQGSLRVIIDALTQDAKEAPNNALLQEGLKQVKEYQATFQNPDFQKTMKAGVQSLKESIEQTESNQHENKGNLSM